MPPPIRAKDVQIDRPYRASCKITGCTWTGATYASYADANTDRLTHLAAHEQARAAATAAPVAEPVGSVPTVHGTHLNIAVICTRVAIGGDQIEAAAPGQLRRILDAAEIRATENGLRFAEDSQD